jgi:KDO2-lipid IV(A) lauroyltransferase
MLFFIVYVSGLITKRIEYKHFEGIIFSRLLKRDRWENTSFYLQTYDIFSNHILKSALFAVFFSDLSVIFSSLFKIRKKDEMKQILQLIAYRSTYGVTYAVSLIPTVFLCMQWHLLFFFFAYYLIGYRRIVVDQNVSRSFSDKRYGEIRCIVKAFYVCFIAYFVEMIKSISAPAKVLDKKITFENLELIDRPINTGQNVIVCLGHYGNWEMLNFMPYKLHYDIYAVYKPLRSGIMNRLMIKLRSRFGMKLIPGKSVVRHILTQKPSPAVYLFLADQCPLIKEEKYKFTLLNQETYVFSGMEKLAHISRSAVVYLHIVQLSKGNYKIIPKCPLG